MFVDPTFMRVLCMILTPALLLLLLLLLLRRCFNYRLDIVWVACIGSVEMKSCWFGGFGTNVVEMKMASLGSLSPFPILPVNRFPSASASAAAAAVCPFISSDSGLHACRRGSRMANYGEMFVGGASVLNKKPWRGRGVEATGVRGTEGGGGGGSEEEDDAQGVIQVMVERNNKRREQLKQSFAFYFCFSDV